MSALNFITIAQPCSENPANMRPTDRGHFCQRCNKEVLDLTTYSAEALVAFRAQNPGPMCAAIDADAAGLYRTGVTGAWMRQLRRFFMACLIVFGSNLFVLPNAAFAQQLQELKAMCAPMDYTVEDGLLEFYGTLADDETGETLAGAVVTIPGSEAKTTSDANGHFELAINVNAGEDLPEQLDVLVSAEGYVPEVLPGPARADVQPAVVWRPTRRHYRRFSLRRRRHLRGFVMH